MRSVHDNVVLGYEVDCERRRVVLHTAFREREPEERTDIVFEGVAGFEFDGDPFGTILFSVAQVPLARIRAACAVPAGSEDGGLNGYEIVSSIGMSGFVVARSMELVDADRTLGGADQTGGDGQCTSHN